MNKREFIKELEKETGLSEKDSIVLNDCIEEYFIIGKNNKEKTVNLIVERLGVSEEKADELYNISSGIISKAIKDKIKHPFKKHD